jgi:hypothetical protein
MAKTTIQKTGGAKTLPEIIRNAGLGRREIQTLEACLRNGIQNLSHPSARSISSPYAHTMTAIELAQVNSAVADAGIQLWRHGLDWEARA